MPRGRPRKDPASQRQARRAKRIEQRVSELFEHRHLFVRHHLNVAQRARLRQLVPRPAATAGGPCHHGRGVSIVRPPLPDGHGAGEAGPVASAGAAVPQLGPDAGRVELAEPGEGAGRSWTTSCCPRRATPWSASNRRVRKMQKTVYRVRTRQSLKGRLALDLQRDHPETERGIDADRVY